MVASLQGDSQWPTPPGIPILLLSPSHIVPGLVSLANRIWQKWWCVTSSISLSSHYGVCLVCSLSDICSEGIICLLMSSPVDRHTWWETDVFTLVMWVSAEANCPSQRRLHRIMALADILTTTSGDILSLNLSGTPLPECWPSETLWDNKYFLF